MANHALIEAIKRAGGQSALARDLSAKTGEHIRQGHVWSWLHRTKRVPSEYCIPIELLYGVSRHELRPDIYPRDGEVA